MKGRSVFFMGLVASASLALYGCGGGGSTSGSTQATQTLPTGPAALPIDPACTAVVGTLNDQSLCYLKADYAFSRGLDGTGMTVAVVDQALLYTHVEFGADRLSPASYNYVDNNTNILPNGDEVHGTEVTGAAAGKNLGVARNANILFMKSVLDSSTTPSAIAGAIGAGAHIVNVSGWMTADIAWMSVSYLETLMPGGLDVIDQQGDVTVWGAGNASQITSSREDNYIAYMTQQDPSFTQDGVANDVRYADNIVVVGAVLSKTGEFASWSATPGYRTEIQNRWIVADGQPENLAGITSSTEYVNGFYGTSYAAPQVTGAIALLQQAKPSLTASQAAQILLDTADRPASMGYGTTCQQTTALGTFSSDCGAMKMGRGILNIKSALIAAGVV